MRSWVWAQSEAPLVTQPILFHAVKKVAVDWQEVSVKNSTCIVSKWKTLDHIWMSMQVNFWQCFSSDKVPFLDGFEIPGLLTQFLFFYQPTIGRLKYHHSVCVVHAWLCVRVSLCMSVCPCAWVCVCAWVLVCVWVFLSLALWGRLKKRVLAIQKILAAAAAATNSVPCWASKLMLLQFAPFTFWL